jgi:DNA mismatch endonuclease, patch repair protein
VPSSAAKSGLMARVRRRDTKPELELRRILHARGLRFRIDRAVLADRRRRADVVFGPAKVAVFVDGCFWHGCAQHATWPKANEAYWREKIETNRLRDRDTDERLRALGWEVVRIWEHEDSAVAADRLEKIVRNRRGH